MFGEAQQQIDFKEQPKNQEGENTKEFDLAEMNPSDKSDSAEKGFRSTTAKYGKEFGADSTQLSEAGKPKIDNPFNKETGNLVAMGASSQHDITGDGRAKKDSFIS